MSHRAPLDTRDPPTASFSSRGRPAVTATSASSSRTRRPPSPWPRRDTPRAHASSGRSASRWTARRRASERSSPGAGWRTGAAPELSVFQAVLELIRVRDPWQVERRSRRVSRRCTRSPGSAVDRHRGVRRPGRGARPLRVVARDGRL